MSCIFSYFKRKKVEEYIFIDSVSKKIVVNSESQDEMGEDKAGKFYFGTVDFKNGKVTKMSFVRDSILDEITVECQGVLVVKVNRCTFLFPDPILSKNAELGEMSLPADREFMDFSGDDEFHRLIFRISDSTILVFFHRGIVVSILSDGDFRAVISVCKSPERILTGGNIDIFEKFDLRPIPFV